jgi:hypothetical protein
MEFMAYYARLQKAISPKPPKLNLFFFVGPEDKPDDIKKRYTTFAIRNGGSFQLLTTKRLEEIVAREAEARKKGL